jgi:hypothetical protein
MLMRSFLNSMTMRFSFRPSPPSTPCAPPKASGTIGKVEFSSSNSPTSSVSTCTVAAIEVPVTPRSRAEPARTGNCSSSATCCVTAERLAPVSSTRR